MGGHLRYYGVPANSRALRLFRLRVGRLWYRSMRAIARVDVAWVFDRLPAGGSEVETQRVLAAGGDAIDELRRVLGAVDSFQLLQVAVSAASV